MASPRKQKAVAPEFTLEAVIAATQAGNFLMTPPSFHDALVATGTVEINPEMIDEHGNIATRAVLNQTKEETEMTEDTTQTLPGVEAVATAKPKFEIETGELPVRVRKTSGNRAGRTPLYPFDQLTQENQFFFVPGKTAKALASTLAGAMARYSEVVEGQTKKNRKGEEVPVLRKTRRFEAFDSSKVSDEGVEIQGVKVFRVALKD